MTRSPSVVRWRTRLKSVGLGHPVRKHLSLFSDGNVPCGKLVKENASIYNGKGGGSDTNARAIFPSKDGMMTFIDLLEKHLR